MIEQIKEILNQIPNPASGSTLGKEQRWQIVTMEGEKLVAQYNRDGISPSEKRIIESEIQKSLSSLVGVDNILIKTTSSQSQDVFKSLEQAPTVSEIETQSPPAQLKVGHGTVGNKKNVPGVGKVIAIGSGKGGVGKSTFTANLALTLAKGGYKVGVIDADIYGPSMPMIFGKRNEKPRSNSERKIIPVESFGIKFMSFGFFINENDPVIWRGPMLGGVLSQFLFDVDWSDTDYLLIDLPPGTGDIQLSMIQNAHVDGAIIISTPQDIALLDAKKGLEMFKKLNLPIIGMVENMSAFICHQCGTEHHIFGEGGVEKAVQELGVNLLGKVPLEIELRTGSDMGVPYMSQDAYLNRPVWKSFLNVGENVNRFFNPDMVSPKTSFFSKILGHKK
jgi:ATP-binding protein involved in chromosome partitioning